MIATAFSEFLIASLILALIHGPGVIHIVTQTLNRGRRAGLASIVAIAPCTDSLYALAAAKLATKLRGRSQWSAYGRYVSAAAFIGLGLYAACASPRAAR